MLASRQLPWKSGLIRFWVLYSVLILPIYAGKDAPPHPACKITLYRSARNIRRSMLLKSTTRHIRIFAAEVNHDELVPSSDTLTLDIDPDNELLWNPDALQQIYRKFDELVANYAGADLTDYNLRRIGSDLEHLVRSLLQQGVIAYNMGSRVRNYSLGVPRAADDGGAGNHLAIE